MKNYKFSSHVLARIPLLDWQTSENNFASVLQREDFRAALFLASRSFYNELAKKEFDYSLLSDKHKQAIKKYINRARFRSTPFGLFASVSLINWAEAGEFFELSEPVANIYPDFCCLYESWRRQSEKNADKSGVFQTNASLHINSLDYRYFKKLVDRNCIRFSMVSVEKDRLLQSLLQFCKKPKTWQDINGFLVKKNIPLHTAESFLNDLVQEQILVSNAAPNITGPGYHPALEEIQKNDPAISGFEQQVATKVPASAALQHVLSVAGRMDHDINMPGSTNHFYCISERSSAHGSLSLKYQKSIEEGLYCLSKLSQPFINKDLQSFVTAFEKKYEGEEIPLLEALDPQFGIGYGDFDKIKANYGFLSTVYDTEKNQSNSASGQNELASWMINECHLRFEDRQELEITDRQLDRLNKPGVAENSAPSLSVVFRTLGDKVWIESAGGNSALALLGRFSILDNVYQHALTIAKEEQRHNKHVIFAEIAHLCNLHTANINRRPHFYKYEIPVLTASVLPANKQVQLGDLMISVRGGRVNLRSKKLKKLIVPRLSSAFNYSRNDLPVFRFLCDLQGQGINGNLNFSLASIIPGLPFYPRVSYKSSILQLAEWHLDSFELQNIQRSESPFNSFQNLAERMNLPVYFSYCVGDNFLVFNKNNEEDIHLFLREVDQHNLIILKEFPFINQNDSEAPNGQHLLTQYVASMCLQKEVYGERPVYNRQSKLMTSANDWIYFKLYCHPLSSDIILLHHFFPLIEKLKKNHLVLSWFWVRYNDPEYHLRIRVRVKPRSGNKVIQLTSICLEKICASGLAGHFQRDRYKRELERYSSGLIEKVEDIFQASSEWVAAFLNGRSELDYNDPAILLNAVLSSSVMLNAFYIPGQAAICKTAFEGFFAEFNNPKELKTEMEKLYRQLEERIDDLLDGAPKMEQFESLVQSVNNLVAAHRSGMGNEVALEKLALDMIHMHLNRLFIYKQRYFEMIHYYLLQRNLYKRLHKMR